MRQQTPAGRILVGEDQPEIQDALSLLLGGAGYTVSSAFTPADILRRLDQESPFDLLLMDLNYHRDTTSGSEGLEVLGALRQSAASPPVIVMTAWGSVDLAVKAMHLGARDFIQKPWENSHLLHLVEKHVEDARSERLLALKHRREIQEAVEVQRRLMPSKMPSMPGVEMAGGCWPAAEVAGDYFDVFQFGDRVAVCIADVIGKGLPAALLMSNLQAAVKVTASETVSPAELCRRVNQLCCRNGASDKFISFFYGILHPETGELRYCNAGHLPPVIWSANQQGRKLSCEDAVLGLWPDWQYHECVTELRRGDQMLLYTDGLSEAASEDGEEFGEEGILASLQEHSQAPCQSVLDQLTHDASGKCSGQFADDVTCLLVRMV
jgi:sigma-B regulation protein RsbU (phosphoserine phosphatase)